MCKLVDRGRVGERPLCRSQIKSKKARVSQTIDHKAGGRMKKVTVKAVSTVDCHICICHLLLLLNQTCIKIFNIYCPDNKDLSLHNFDVPQENCIVLGDLNSHSTCW